MHYLIETVGPISQDTLTEAVLTYMNYPSYVPPNSSRSMKPFGLLRVPSLLLSEKTMATAVQGAFENKFQSFNQAKRPSSALSAIQTAMGTPMMLQTGNLIQVRPGVHLRQLSNLGRTYQDVFFWTTHGTTQVLGVSGRGAHYAWTTLPPGWDNRHFNNAPPAPLGTFTPGQPTVEVSKMSTAQKVGQAMYRSLAYVGEEAKPIVLQLISPEAIGYVLAIEAAYTVSLFFGVGEVLTLGLVVTGVYFVGRQVVEIIQSLVSFSQAASAAKSEAELEAAARHFAHALTLGVDIVVNLLSRKMSRPGKPATVLRAKPQGGGGKLAKGLGNNAEPSGSATKSSVIPPTINSPNGKGIIKNRPPQPKKGKGKNKLEAHENAQGDHSTFERDKNGDIYKYETYEKTPTGHNNPKVRFDGGKPDGTPGAPHRDKTGKEISTPHVQGKSIPEGVRTPTSDELPKNKRFPK